MLYKTRLFAMAATVAVTACSVKETPQTADTAADTAAVAAAPIANVVNITATDYKFEAPDQIPAGLTKFNLTDNGKAHHHASLIRLDSGKTFEEFMAGMKAMKPRRLGNSPFALSRMRGGEDR